MIFLDCNSMGVYVGCQTLINCGGLWWPVAIVLFTKFYQINQLYWTSVKSHWTEAN